MTKAPAAFAIPGDITTKTGGYIYENRLLHGLRDAGRPVWHLELPASFPDPDAQDMAAAIAALVAVPSTVPLIIDGLIFGAIETRGLDAVKAPICAMIHHPLALETGLSVERSALLSRREADNLARAAHVVVPSSHTASVLQVDYGVAADRISIAAPGFPPADPVRQEECPPMILSVGILHPRKGHDILLRALARIVDLDWRAEIVGARYDQAYANSLDLLNASLGLAGRVTLTGMVDDKALRERYRAASLFALATLYEGYGIVLGEALCHGLPIITCGTGAVPDTVPRGAGLLVSANDPGAFADALRRMLSDSDLRRRSALVSAKAGRVLPSWADTAAVMDRVLDGLAAQSIP